MDTDISHAQQAINDDHETRLAAIEEHLGLADADDAADDDGNGEDKEDGE